MKRKISNLIVNCIRNNGKIFIFGCGGLASESDHFAGELVGKYLHQRRALPAISLCSNQAIITAIANDYGFENVFSRQIEALGKEGDVAIGMSTSGKSKSVIKALKTARKMGLFVVDWPREKGLNTPKVQEKQIKLMHDVCKLVEEAFI